MEDAFIIHGGKKLGGEMHISGAKNIALKVLIASLLYDDPIEFKNIPNIADIRELSHLLFLSGAKIEFIHNSIRIDPRSLSNYIVDMLHGSKIRVSFMLFAPFLHKFHKAEIPNPGGCRIGARPIDRIIDMLTHFGAKIEYDSNTGYYKSYLPDKVFHACNYTFEKPTHTGTELALMCAVLADGTSIIDNAALEPEIDDLISLFQKSGVLIHRSGKKIIIKGAKKLTVPKIPFKISGDRIEAATFAIFSLATKGKITIKGIESSWMDSFNKVILKMGGIVEKSKDSIYYAYKSILKPIDIETSPHPGFITDWQSPLSVLLSCANGISTIHETVYESRFGYVSELKKLGAKIEYFQPNIKNYKDVYQFNISDTIQLSSLQQAIRIWGPTTYHNGVVHVSDMRAGATLMIGASLSPEESIVQGASVIDRGYDAIEKKLQNLGLNISRV